MASDAIPAFRLDDAALEPTSQPYWILGVKMHHRIAGGPRGFELLAKPFDYIYIAVGAQNSLGLNIPGMDSGRCLTS
jgi:putative selenate reductase